MQNSRRRRPFTTLYPQSLSTGTSGQIDVITGERRHTKLSNKHDEVIVANPSSMKGTHSPTLLHNIATRAIDIDGRQYAARPFRLLPFTTSAAQTHHPSSNIIDPHLHSPESSSLLERLMYEPLRS